ncbi:MAG: hypothetical protein JSS79_08870 [Bacteroidetes bacterium]|nr:hypothetical protein [Bacteroidota bacterium]
MKKSLVYILSSIMLIVTIDWALGSLFDSLYAKILLGQTGGKINYYLRQKDFSVVVMGNSRALYQINPDSLGSNCFNLSHAGMSQIFHTGLVHVLEQEKKMPRLILLHLEPEEFTFADHGTDIQNLKYYYGKDSLVTAYLRNVSPYERFKFLFHLYRYNGRAASILKNYWYSRRPLPPTNGFESLVATDRDSINTFYSAEKIEPIKTTALNEVQVEYLEEFIKTCSRSNTKLVCFTSPLFTEPRGLNQVTAKLTAILARHKVPYISADEIDVTKYPHRQWLWKDAHHLTNYGAAIESKLLADWFMLNHKIIE